MLPELRAEVGAVTPKGYVEPMVADTPDRNYGLGRPDRFMLPPFLSTTRFPEAPELMIGLSVRAESSVQVLAPGGRISLIGACSNQPPLSLSLMAVLAKRATIDGVAVGPRRALEDRVR